MLRAAPTFLLAAAAATKALSSPVNCATFRLTNVNSTLITGSTFYAKGDSVDITTLYSSIDTNKLPAFCRLELVITTNSTANSTAHTEVWLPEDWNGRFLAIGNGGFSGGVAVGDLGYIAMNQGFAGMSTDTGHSSGPWDGTWAGPGNDNAIIDFGWRALHLSAVVAKEVVKQYYNASQNTSYYFGCSTGGRQGLKEIQDFPEEFDGVVVGSPANWMTHFLPAILRAELDVQPVNSSRWIPDSTWKNVIHPEVLNQCDELDGLKDGIINNPLVCYFRPETLSCRPNQDPATCLSIDQIDVLHKLYTDYYETNQTYILGGFYPGGEVGMSTYVLGTTPLLVADQFYQYFVLNDTTWNKSNFDFSTIEAGVQVNPGNMDAISPNLTSFAGHQGKVIHYVGWAENLVSAGNSLHYYETVHAFMRSHSKLDMDNFYRLFTVPGMEHCLSGFGANAFGGISQAASGMPPTSYDADHNILASMVRWVEEGIAPETITATYYNNNTAVDGIGFTRPLCKYPKNAIYIGSNPDDAESFNCV